MKSIDHRLNNIKDEILRQMSDEQRVACEEMMLDSLSQNEPADESPVTLFEADIESQAVARLIANARPDECFEILTLLSPETLKLLLKRSLAHLEAAMGI